MGNVDVESDIDSEISRLDKQGIFRQPERELIHSHQTAHAPPVTTRARNLRIAQYFRVLQKCTAVGNPGINQLVRDMLQANSEQLQACRQAERDAEKNVGKLKKQIEGILEHRSLIT